MPRLSHCHLNDQYGPTIENLLSLDGDGRDHTLDSPL